MTEESPATIQRDDPPRFQFVRELGRGVLGEAHEVIDEATGEPVVLKIFVRCKPLHPDRFKLEFEALARLKHESLVKFHHLVDPASDTNVDIESRLGASGLAFTQEYVEGEDLLTWLKRSATSEDLVTLDSRRTPTTGEMPLSDETGGESEGEEIATGATDLHTSEELPSLDIAESIVEEIASSSSSDSRPTLDLVLLRLERVVPQIVEGLQYLHRYHKVHGFLRPSNILVTRAGNVRLTDYGIVPNLAYRHGDDASTSSETISLMCAPEQLPYVAPEIRGEATAAGDLYALGCVLFEAVAGFPPADAMEVVAGRTHRLELPPLAELVPECPAVWAERIDALLKPDPQDRPSLAAIAVVMGEGRAVQLPPTIVPQPEGFVGQTAILSELRAEAHGVSEGEAMRFVLLEGAAGSGKSLLLQELAHWLSRRGWLVISGQCFNRESVPLQGWHEIADRLASVIEGLPLGLQDQVSEDRAIAGVLFPCLLGDAPAAGGVRRLGAIRALRRLLGFLAEQRPILLCIEDLHWASWDTASLLMDLFSETAQIRCFMVGTWRTDSARSNEHFLTRDIELSLVEVRRLSVRGFTTDEAREFLIKRAPDAGLDELRGILRAGRANPRILRELLWEQEHQRLDEVDLVAGSGRDLLPELFAARMGELGKPHEAMLNILSVASGPLEHDWLCRAVRAELSGSVLPAEQTLEAIEAAFAQNEELRLVRRSEDTRHRTQWGLAHDVVREVLLEAESEREQARLAGRIADAVGEDRADKHDLRFEYELRASRVAKAIKAAVRAARTAESRFAFHRSAKLWRWLLDNEDKLADPSVHPRAELARVEHLAGQHAEAAELYRSWAEESDDRMRRAKIRADEAAAWLQAGQIDAAVEALEGAYRAFGQTYVGKWHASVSETPRRLVATLVRWNEKLATAVKPGKANKNEVALGRLYDFSLEYNAWLLSGRADEIESRLAHLASSAGDTSILASHRMRLALLHAGEGVASKRDRAFQWMDEADRIARALDDPAPVAQVALHRGILQIRFGEYDDASVSLTESSKLADQSDSVGVDRRRVLYWRGMLDFCTGDLAAAEGLARQLLHTYRGDRVAGSMAYSLLTEVSLLRGDAPLAAAFLDAGRESVISSRPNVATASWYGPLARLHIALGRPEVAVGQLLVFEEDMAGTGQHVESVLLTDLRLGLGQAAAALAERQRVLAEPRQDETHAILRRIQREIEPLMDELDGLRRAEVLRFFARAALVYGKPRKALKFADAAVEALGGITSPIEVGRCAEARGQVLQRLERPEARGIIEQSWELYRQYNVSYPLVLEGWPVPREAAMLKED